MNMKIEGSLCSACYRSTWPPGLSVTVKPYLSPVNLYLQVNNTAYGKHNIYEILSPSVSTSWVLGSRLNGSGKCLRKAKSRLVGVVHSRLFWLLEKITPNTDCCLN